MVLFSFCFNLFTIDISFGRDGTEGKKDWKILNNVDVMRYFTIDKIIKKLFVRFVIDIIVTLWICFVRKTI